MIDSAPSPSLSKNDLIRDFRDLGIQAGDLLLVHSSISKIGWVEGGPERVIEALLEVLGPEGTLLAPALTGSADDGPFQPPRFDARSTPCWTGLLPSLLLRWPGVRRSAHPTHSVVAVGALASLLTEGHENSKSPCDAGSPYAKLSEANGKILLIGVDHQSNTTLHSVEEEAGLPYVLQDGVTSVTFTDEAGREITRKLRLHSWDTPRDFNRLEPELISRGVERVGTVGLAASRLVEANAMARIALACLVNDPGFFLPRNASVIPSRDSVRISIERLPHAQDLPLPVYATSGAAGMDLHAAVEETVTLSPGGRDMIPTGLKIALPPGYEAQIRPRSGLAAKRGITCLNSPGTIDEDYRGEIRVILINHGAEPFEIQRGERIAQMVIASYIKAAWEEKPVDEDTSRGAGGFGHTGVELKNGQR